MFLVIDPLGTGEWWKPLRALRPNWVWWSVDEGWSIDDDDPYQKVYGPVASVFGSAADLVRLRVRVRVRVRVSVRGRLRFRIIAQ